MQFRKVLSAFYIALKGTMSSRFDKVHRCTRNLTLHTHTHMYKIKTFVGKSWVSMAPKHFSQLPKFCIYAKFKNYFANDNKKAMAYLCIYFFKYLLVIPSHIFQRTFLSNTYYPRNFIYVQK